MSLIIDPQLHQQFKMATAAQGTEMTIVLLEFIENYVAKHLPKALRQKKGGR